MLILKHVTIKDQNHHVLIEELNYSLGNEDKVGIIGEEGNGKSTLLKAIYDPALLDDYAVMSGSIETDMKRIGYFEQCLSSKWEDSDVHEYLLKQEPEEEIAPEEYNRLQNFEVLCKEVQLEVSLLSSDQPIKTLSGGEKVKLQLLKLLEQHLDLLLLDEPTNDLDVETLEWLEQFLRELRIPVLFISHDETLLERVATIILHIEQRNKKTKSVHTIYRGRYEEYRKTRESHLKKEAQIVHKEQQEYRKKMIHLNDQRNAVHDALNDTVRSPYMAKLLKKKMKNIKSIERRYEKEGDHKIDTVEEAINLHFGNIALPPSKRILEFTLPELRIQERVLIQNIKIELRGQDKAVILGRNGCGKSLLLGQIHAYLTANTDLKIGYMPQEYATCFQAEDTPVRFLLEEGDLKDVTRSRELLGRMKFTQEEMLHSVQELSEGQKAKLYLLRFIKTDCQVLLLDEPTRNLSPLSSPMIRRMLKEFQGCILAVSHDRKFIAEVFDVQYHIHDGQCDLQR